MKSIRFFIIVVVLISLASVPSVSAGPFRLAPWPWGPAPDATPANHAPQPNGTPTPPGHQPPGTPPDDGGFEVQANGEVNVAGLKFDNLSEYFESEYFKETGKRCGTRPPTSKNDLTALPGDCTLSQTVIQSGYWPSQTYTIPVVFHIIHKTDGTGNISDQHIYDQMQVLNEDFRALPGTLGEAGFDTMIQFQLVDITRTANSEWFDDRGELQFKRDLGWDPNRYMNVYVNSASGYLGYSTLPQQDAGSVIDGIVMLYEVVGGRDMAFDSYDQGRTLVHETGHYLGLLHTFEGYGCYEGYAAGDLVADTHSEDDEHYGCTQTNSCGTPDDIHNYMNYTDDICMHEFTSEQANRAICSLVNYRPLLFHTFLYLPLVSRSVPSLVHLPVVTFHSPLPAPPP